YTALLTDGEYSLSATSVPASQENGFMTITATYIYRGTPFTAAFRVYVYDESTTEMTVESADEFRGAALVLNGKTGTIKVGASFTVSDYTTEFRTGSNVTIEGLSPTSNYVITFSGGAVGNGGLVIGNGAVVTLKNLNIVGASAFAPIQRSDRYAYFSVEANARFVLINCDIRAVTSGSHYLTFIANGCTVDATDTTFTNNVRVFYGTGDGVGSNVYLRGNSKSTATSSYTLYRGTFILYDTASYSGNLAYNTIVDFRNTGISHSEDGEWVTLTKTGVTTSSLLFTTDGSDPTTSLTVRTYTAPFGIDRNTTVKAVLFIEGFYGDVVTYEIEYTGEIDDILEDILVLTSLPAKLVYAQGQTADFTGLAVAVKYTDGATAVLTAIDYDITGFSSATISENVTVTVWFGSDLKATFTISVKWATYFEDVVEGDRVTGLITALPATVTFADGTQIAAARTAYDALTTQQKGLVTSLDALTSAEAKWNVVNKINALPATIALSDKSNIVAARAAFDLLTETQQSQVANIAKLLTAESALAVLEQNASIDEAAAANVIGMINNLPAVIGLGDELAIMLARSSYTALTGTQKELVTNLAKLTTAETALADAKTAKAAADVVVGQIDALPAVVILTSETAIVAARSAYDGLSDAAKAYVTNLAKLTTAETALQSAKDAAATLAADRAAADTVIGLIDALPSTITNANAVAITAARTAYNGLTSARQALVTNLSKLTSAETAFGNIVKSIAITGNPSKTSYKTGETLDTTGLTVTFTRNNNTTAAVALSDCEITGFDSSTAGTKTITVKYQGFSQTFTVTVTEDDVKGCSTVSAGNPWIMGGGLFSLILMLALTTLVRRKRAVARAK
ncbi:MAG: bacterial Ig-like domain-containing protein, partial [Firmicutes bacterium]|nr:bacterial Ig-like domain-containing protein [Bacillota bacterium]